MGKCFQSLPRTNYHECVYLYLYLLATAPTLQDYTMVVIDANRASACFTYGRGDTLLGLLHEDGHYNALSSLPGFFGKSYFCSRCFQAYNNQGQLACPNNKANHCGACLQDGCQDHADAFRHYRSADILCHPCGRSFYGDESMQVDGRHFPNLVVAETESPDRPVSFKGDDCLLLFLAWLETLTENGKQPLTVLAHNFKGYDSYPVIDELHRQKRQLEQVRNGSKVLQLTYSHEDTTLRFIDSLSFFQMPLSDFPKTFGLTELKKGHFPHLFNTP